MARPTFDEVATTIASLLKVDPSRITRETTAEDVDGWDSVRHAGIILTLEETYDIQFSDDEVIEAPDVGALYDRLIAHSGG